jgi:nucleotide-binding universal stress UspA family protein
MHPPGARADHRDPLGRRRPRPVAVRAGRRIRPEIALGDDEARVDADIKEAAAQFTAHGLSVTSHVVVGEPVTVIARLVEELAIDLLILGHPRSTSFALRWWRGSTDALLLDRVRCSILVAADPGR